MKTFRCGDIVPDCEHDFVAPTDDELMQIVAVHAAEVHGMSEVPPELAAQIRSMIVAV